MRFLASKTGVVHIVDARRSDPGATPCPAVARALNAGSWKGQRSLKPEAVLEMKDCAKCGTFKAARAALRVEDGRTEMKSMGAKVKKSRNTAPVNQPVADERTTLKAKEHANLAEQHGWTVTIERNENRGLTVIATRGNESCVLTYREGGFLNNPGIVFKVPGRTVPLHNSGTWRRQVSLPEGKRPISAKPKRAGRAPKSKAEDPEPEINGAVVVAEEVIPLNKSSLPFLLDDDDATIIDAIKGSMLYWRNNMMAKVVSARVPSRARLIRFAHTARGNRRYVSFPEAEMTKDGEIYGAERAVAIEDMLRVRH